MRRLGILVTALAALTVIAPGARAASYDPRIVHVMVNQGVQEFTTHGTPQISGTRRVAGYNGKTLQEGRKTVVKVYANFPESLGTAVTGFNARLIVRRQTSSGVSTLGTLVPDAPQQAVGQGSDQVSLNQVRGNTTGVFTFTLPFQFTGQSDGDGDGRFENTAPFRLSLLAELIPPNDSSALQRCTTAACVANDRLQVDNVTFVSVCCVDVATVKVIGKNPKTGVYYPEPRPIRTALAPALRITPVDISLPDFQVTLDISNTLQRDLEANPEGYIDPKTGQSPIPCCYGERIGRLLDIIKADRFPSADAIFGLYSKDMVGGQARTGTGWTNDDANRPLTNIAHEFQHVLGRNHYSSACDGGIPSDPADPDRIGLIQGIGLLDTGSPYRMTLSPSGIPSSPGMVPADRAGVYDLMSYCAPQGLANETNGRTWLSVFGWQDLVTRFRYTGATARAAQAPAPPQLAVYGDVAPDGAVRVLSALPGKLPAGLVPSPFRLVARDGAGAVLADVAMGRRASSSHGSAGSPPGTGLVGLAPIDPAVARRVEIVRDGAAVAALDRSAHAPTAAFVSPRQGETIGRGESVEIRWQAGDADGGDLEITVEWSREGGRTGTWRPVFLGPHGGIVKLPSDYFAGSGDAQLRLRANDGFNETVVLSEKFKAVSRPPRIEIVEPRPGARVRARSGLTLRARAFNERAQPLGDKRVVWTERGRRVATGTAVTLRRVRRGRHTYRATVTDPVTRKRARATVRVRVR